MYSLNGIPFKKNFLKIERTDKYARTNGHTDKRTDRRSDYIMPQILFGGIKTSPIKVIAKRPLTNLYEMNSSSEQQVTGQQLVGSVGS